MPVQSVTAAHVRSPDPAAPASLWQWLGRLPDPWDPRALVEHMAEADAELTSLRKKLRSELVYNVGLTGLSVALTIGIDFGASLASWIPKFVGAMPAMHAGTNILDAIKDYIQSRREVHTKRAFLLGSKMGRVHG